MGVYYQMLCMDCGEVFHLGKRALWTRHGTKPHPTFTAFRLGGSVGQASSQDASIAMLEHFIARHVLHELRVLPDDTVIAPYESEVFPSDFDRSNLNVDDEGQLAAYLQVPVRLDQAEQEAASLPGPVLDRISELSKGVAVHDPLRPYDENPRSKRNGEG